MIATATDMISAVAGGLRLVSAVTTPVGYTLPEGLSLGFVPFPRRTYSKPRPYEMPQGGRILLGEHGLFDRRNAYAGENSLIVVSGAKGSGRTSRFVVPAIADADGADVVVSDIGGDLTERLGDTWRLHGSGLRIDPRAATSRRSPAFNPLHPDMMGKSHLDTAEWMSHVLVSDDDAVSDAARSLFVGVVSVVVVEPRLRAGTGDVDDVATLPMVVQWLQEYGRRIEGIMHDVAASAAIDARIRFERFLEMPAGARRDALETLMAALAFVTTPGMTAILAPTDEDRGAALASALVLKQKPALVVVGGDDGAGQGVLCALVMEAAMHLKGSHARRETHVYVDDASAVGPMPWLRAALAGDEGTRNGVSAVVILEHPGEIDELAPGAIDGRMPGVAHWIVEEVHDPADRARIADAMSVRRAKVTSHRADRHRLDVGRGTTRNLRR